MSSIQTKALTMAVTHLLDLRVEMMATAETVEPHLPIIRQRDLLQQHLLQASQADSLAQESLL
jgi:hypothetical protein